MATPSTRNGYVSGGGYDLMAYDPLLDPNYVPPPPPDNYVPGSTYSPQPVLDPTQSVAGSLQYVENQRAVNPQPIVTDPAAQPYYTETNPYPLPAPEAAAAPPVYGSSTNMTEASKAISPLAPQASPLLQEAQSASWNSQPATDTPIPAIDRNHAGIDNVQHAPDLNQRAKDINYDPFRLLQDLGGSLHDTTKSALGAAELLPGQARGPLAPNDRQREQEALYAPPRPGTPGTGASLPAPWNPAVYGQYDYLMGDAWRQPGDGANDANLEQEAAGLLEKGGRTIGGGIGLTQDFLGQHMDPGNVAEVQKSIDAVEQGRLASGMYSQQQEPAFQRSVREAVQKSTSDTEREKRRRQIADLGDNLMTDAEMTTFRPGPEPATAGPVYDAANAASQRLRGAPANTQSNLLDIDRFLTRLKGEGATRPAVAPVQTKPSAPRTIPQRPTSILDPSEALSSDQGYSPRGGQTSLEKARAKMSADGIIDGQGNLKSSAVNDWNTLTTGGLWNEAAVKAGVINADAMGKTPNYLHLKNVQKGSSLEQASVPYDPANDPNATVVAADTSGSSGSSGGGGYDNSGGGYQKSRKTYYDNDYSSGGGGYSSSGRRGFRYDSNGDGAVTEDDESVSSWRDFLEDLDGDGEFSMAEMKAAKKKFKLARGKKTRGKTLGGSVTSKFPLFGGSTIRKNILAALEKSTGRKHGGWPERV